MKKLFLLPVLAFTIIACNSGEGDKKAELDKLKKQQAEIKAKIDVLEAELSANDSSASAMTVSVMPLKAMPFKNYIDVQGRVDADENISLSTEMPGTITKINVKPGDEVSAGQVLAETDARAVNQQISDLQTNAALVNQVYEKQKALWDQKIGTEIQFLQAKTNKESMEKKMQTLQEQVRMTKIISPISGTVDAVDIKLGQAVAPGMPAIRVINFSNLKVKADVAESYASKIKKGSEVVVHFPDTKDSLVTKVNFVSRAINNASRTFTVEVLLDDKKEYHPNMVARLNINDYQSPQPAITVPVRTIQKDESNQSFVFVAENGIAKKRIVTLGKEYKGQAEITSGLKEEDILVTLGYDLINDGDNIVYNK
ncbi:MAG: efflux transporter periplasmic adaptor subunit [Bacteroidetes bacterium]|jgi:RND family efflux transporter MFP subunit|nr:efflux transporter periplasmic adaptor subunit [Bacteroidota bacterium]